MGHLSTLAAALDQEQVQRQKAAGFRNLRFSDPLEWAYQQHRAGAVRQRARPVALSALVLFALYAVIDGLTLPPELSQQTIAVRLLLMCPLALVVLVLSGSRLPAIPFSRFYTASFLLGGLCIVLILFLARRQGHALPYDGLHPMLMFGFLVMGLAFRGAALGASGIVIAYITTEVLAAPQGIPVVSNAFFLVTSHLIGMVGAWLQEHAGRSHFLDSILLEKAREQAQNASTQKTRFLASASHDLRQPLHVINLLIQSLNLSPNPAQRALLMGRLRTTTQQLEQLLGSLLDLSRLKEGILQPTPQVIEARAILERVHASVIERAEREGVHLRLTPPEEPVKAYTDPMLLERILMNLLNNALTHAGATELTLALSVSEQQVVFHVSDNGEGIPEAEQYPLTGSLTEQPRPEPEKPGGMRLGLSIVRELTELIGGECRIQSACGQGSHFRIAVDRARSE